MANVNTERKLAIDTAIKELEVVTAADLIQATMDLLEKSGPQNIKHVTASVYATIRHYVAIGRLEKIPHSNGYTKNLFIEDRSEQPDILKGKSAEEVIEIFSTWARNIELKPEAAQRYQNRIAELAGEVEGLKSIHAKALAHAKAEYDKINNKLKHMVDIATK